MTYKADHRLAVRQPIQRDDFFPGELVGGTPAHGCNIGRREAPGMSALKADTANRSGRGS
jgi:hypothetical protein